jgi:hypothetical protein
MVLLSVAVLNAASLTLDEAISLLKEQNLEIKAAKLEAKSAHSDVTGQWLPLRLA